MRETKLLGSPASLLPLWMPFALCHLLVRISLPCCVFPTFLQIKLHTRLTCSLSLMRGRVSHLPCYPNGLGYAWEFAHFPGHARWSFDQSIHRAMQPLQSVADVTRAHYICGIFTSSVRIFGVLPSLGAYATSPVHGNLSVPRCVALGFLISVYAVP
jgi:hypothetical protein